MEVGFGNTMTDKRVSDLREDLNRMLQASISALCHCYDRNSDGLYPENCSCEDRKKVNESISMLISEHKRLIRKYVVPYESVNQ